MPPGSVLRYLCYRRNKMIGIDVVLKVGGVGMIVAVICQVLSRIGRDEQSTLVSITGIIIIFLLLASELGELIGALRGVFGL